MCVSVCECVEENNNMIKSQIYYSIDGLRLCTYTQHAAHTGTRTHTYTHYLFRNESYESDSIEWQTEDKSNKRNFIENA